MLAIARALAGNPSLLLLDEPCEGLAPVIVEELARVILEIKNTIPVLLAEQNAIFALSISDRGYVIDKGVIRYEGSRQELLSNTEIQSRYLSV
jgi:branched-chain amino acid transport system ATP-binding protein